VNGKWSETLIDSLIHTIAKAHNLSCLFTALHAALTKPANLVTPFLFSSTMCRPTTNPRHRGLRLVSAKEFSDLSHIMIGSNPTTKKHYDRFQASFGIPPRLVAQVWKDIAQRGYLNHLGPRSLRPVHLLWGLYWLKCYNKEENNSATAGCDEKTFRKWSWFYATCVADLETKYVSFNSKR
jgi:hypothetical protein